MDDLESTNRADENGHLLHRALEMIRAEFEQNTWQAFHRTAVDGHAPALVAAELRISRNAVYVAKSRVLCRLRDELEGLCRFASGKGEE